MSKLHGMIAQCPALPDKIKLNTPRNAPFHMKARVSPKYPENMQQTYRRTAIRECDFNKAPKQLY